ncbi:MAG: NAD-dependent epimerase/dehydratase family protein [Anaerolineales bacterium]|nr:NAD-dependent epimerase/dehydratase family protein [Anaerolineales bacterium]
MSNDLVFVTGATGFLGHHLVPQLLAEGFRVRALVRETSDTHHLAHPNVELVIGDVLDPAKVQQAVAGCRYGVHAAGLFRFWGRQEDFERVNVQGTAHVVEAARRFEVEKLIHISTIAVVGEHPPGIVIDETVKCRPADPYQRSKLDAENLVNMFVRGANLPAVVLRPGAFYGPWGRYAFNRLFFEDPLRGLRIQVENGRRLTFPAFVPDVARAIVAALRLARPGEIYNVCGESLTHREANDIISRLAGISPWRLNVPSKLMLHLARWLTACAERTGREPYYPISLASYVFQDWHVSSDKARTELGFSPTPFEEGARQTLEWYWSQGILRRPRRATTRQL